jgi:hypothetical protein
MVVVALTLVPSKLVKSRVCVQQGSRFSRASVCTLLLLLLCTLYGLGMLCTSYHSMCFPTAVMMLISVRLFAVNMPVCTSAANS